MARAFIKTWIRLIPALAVSLFFAKSVITADSFLLRKGLIHQAEAKYGKEAGKRLGAWEDIIRHYGGTSSDAEKLEKTNQFFNSRIRFTDDIDLWGVKDYWATPIEFLCRGAGDCEDFAIAKYFTLKEMGVADEKLRITYVKALNQNMHHMVLTYYSNPDAEPLVLDNLVDAILPASRRTDLMPIFSFNGTGLWTAKLRGLGKLAGSSNRIKLWQDLLQKMAETKL